MRCPIGFAAGLAALLMVAGCGAPRPTSPAPGMAPVGAHARAAARFGVLTATDVCAAECTAVAGFGTFNPAGDLFEYNAVDSTTGDVGTLSALIGSTSFQGPISDVTLEPTVFSPIVIVTGTITDGTNSVILVVRHDTNTGAVSATIDGGTATTGQGIGGAVAPGRCTLL